MPPMEEVLPRAVIPENNSISLQEFRFSKHESRHARETNSASKQESKPISQERITFPTNNYHTENENKNNIKSLNPQSNQGSEASPPKNKQKPSPNIHNSLTTATETDSGKFFFLTPLCEFPCFLNFEFERKKSFFNPFPEERTTFVVFLFAKN